MAGSTPPKGNLFVIAAPSGAGKTSLVAALVERDKNIHVSISHTTRPKRPNEIEGKHYHFISESEFKKKISENAFLEHALVFDNHYGTSKRWVEEELEKGFDIILEIDWQGAAQVLLQKPDAISIFIMPPSKAIIEDRLKARGEDKPEVIVARMEKFHHEMSHISEFQYVVVNDDFEEAVSDLRAIIQTQRLRFDSQNQKYKNVLAQLMGDHKL